MEERYPLVRIPTQPARMRGVDLLAFFCFMTGVGVGMLAGLAQFGVPGAVFGAVLGGAFGAVIGLLPGHFLQNRIFLEMQSSSNEELRSKLEHPRWTFYQTLALLNLQVRGENVQSYLPRVLTLLAAEDAMTRLFARDALRLVFTPLAVKLDDLGYDPKGDTEDCRTKLSKLREQPV